MWDQGSRKLLTKVTAIFDSINGLAAFLVGVVIIFTMLSVSYDVTTRYFFGQSQLWVIEISEYILVFITFLGAAWVLKREGHVKMDLALTHLKPKPQAVVNIITSTVGAIICLVIVWYSVEVTWDQFQSGYVMVSALAPPRWPIVVIIVVGSFLFFIQFMIRAYGYLQELKSVTKQTTKVADKM